MAASGSIEMCARRTRTARNEKQRTAGKGEELKLARRDARRYERSSARDVRPTTPPSAGAAQRAPIEINAVSLKARFIAVVSSACFFVMGGMEVPPSSRPVKPVENESTCLKNDCPNHDDRASLKNKWSVPRRPI
jgi:hypothetical protein